MNRSTEIVITGMGIISPIGISAEAFWDSLLKGRSGVRRIELYEETPDIPVPMGGEVADFDPRKLVKPRKSLKVMSRDIQLGFVAADNAREDAGLDGDALDRARVGVVFGADMIACDIYELVPAYRKCLESGAFRMEDWGTKALPEMFPLWMLKYLPNMPACHIGIAHDARGPNNSLVQGEASSLAALIEAVRLIERGQADVIIAGGASFRTHPTVWSYDRTFELSRRYDDPAAAVRPFDASRDGMVHGEGAAAFVVEARRAAEARGAKILARVAGYSEAFESRVAKRPWTGGAIRATIRQACERAGISGGDLGYVNARGLGTKHDDAVEAKAIRDTLGDVPVTALKGFFGNLSAASSAVEIAADLMAFRNGRIPYTVNYETPDPECPVNVVRSSMRALDKPLVMKLSQSVAGHSISVVLSAD